MAALTKLTTNINLEMSGDTKRYLVSAKQGDKATRFIVAKLLNNGEPYTIPTGSRAVINILFVLLNLFLCLLDCRLHL